MKISAQFAASLHSPEHIATAEDIGYDRAWLFDTPHESPDVWMMLALAAQCTTTIGLGPGVLVPTLRHPMVNASATAALAALAPGRVAVAFGTGFAGARALGTAPTSWAYPARLRCRVSRPARRRDRAVAGHADTDDAPDGYAPERPIDVPILISALGPKGLDVATELADGLFTVNGQTRFAPISTGPHSQCTAPSWPTANPWIPKGAGSRGPGKRAGLPRRLRIRRRRHHPAWRRRVARRHQPDAAAVSPPRGP